MASDPHTDTPGPLILLVDDEAILRFALRRFLEARGYRVVEAASTADALELLEEREFAAAVLDLCLGANGDRGGFEVARAARALESPPRLLMLTAWASPEVEWEVEELEVDRLLSKPRPLHEVYEVLGELLDLAPGDFVGEPKVASP